MNCRARSDAGVSATQPHAVASRLIVAATSESTRSISVVTLPGSARIAAMARASASGSRVMAASSRSVRSSSRVGAMIGANTGNRVGNARRAKSSSTRTRAVSRSCGVRPFAARSISRATWATRSSVVRWSVRRARSGLADAARMRGRSRGTRVANLAAMPADGDVRAGRRPGSSASVARMAAVPGSTSGRNSASSFRVARMRISESSRIHSRSPADWMKRLVRQSTRRPTRRAPPDSAIRIASWPSGVIGSSRPWNAPKLNQTSGSSWRAGLGAGSG